MSAARHSLAACVLGEHYLGRRDCPSSCSATRLPGRGARRAGRELYYPAAAHRSCQLHAGAPGILGNHQAAARAHANQMTNYHSTIRKVSGTLEEDDENMSADKKSEERQVGKE